MVVFALVTGVSAGDKHHHNHKHDAHHDAQNVIKVDEKGNKTALCACGKELAVTEKTSKLEKDGKTYYMCNEDCAAHFDKDADKFIDAVK